MKDLVRVIFHYLYMKFCEKAEEEKKKEIDFDCKCGRCDACVNVEAQHLEEE